MNPEGGSRILLVEDDPVLSNLLSRSLTRHKYQVEAFAAGAPAVARFTAANAAFAAVVIDLTLPDGRGEDWIERLRSVMPAIPVVAMSGLPGMSLPAGAGLSFLAKPFQTAELVGLLDQLLRESESAASAV
ncbi:MAG: response regulator transcription factor [Bryobacterales bacterium]|nr:response regulator transcription factor [Bryobacterales bacterium]